MAGSLILRPPYVSGISRAPNHPLVSDLHEREAHGELEVRIEVRKMQAADQSTL